MPKEPTPTVRLLGEELKKLHITFQYEYSVRRKHVDIGLREARILIEVDGPCHKRTRGKDFVRDIYSQMQGYKTFRFSNEEVQQNPQKIASFIQAELIRYTQ